MPSTAFTSSTNAPDMRARRPLSSDRPRLGNSWQDLSWRQKLDAAPREPLDILPTAAKRPRTARTRRTPTR